MTTKSKLKRAELHTNLFLAGTNLGTKLDPKSRHHVTLEFDHDKGWLEVVYKDELAWVLPATVAYMIPGEVAPQVVRAEAPKGKIEAQVSTPTSHVFEKGPGKMRDK